MRHESRKAWFVLGSGGSKVLAVHCNIMSEQVDEDGFEYLILDEPVMYKVPKNAARTMTGALRDLREYYDECPSITLNDEKRTPYTLDVYRKERERFSNVGNILEKEHGKEWFHILDVAA